MPGRRVRRGRNCVHSHNLMQILCYIPRVSLVAQMKECACNAGDPGSIPGLVRCPEEGNGNPL